MLILQIFCGSIAIKTISILSVHEHEISFHLFKSIIFRVCFSCLLLNLFLNNLFFLMLLLMGVHTSILCFFTLSNIFWRSFHTDAIILLHYIHM